MRRRMERIAGDIDGCIIVELREGEWVFGREA